MSQEERDWDKRIRDLTKRRNGANLVLFVTLHPAHRVDSIHKEGGVDLEFLRDGAKYGRDAEDYLSFVRTDARIRCKRCWIAFRSR